MNRRQLRERAKALLSIPETGDGQLPDGRLDDLIGESLARLSSDHDWPWLLTSATVTFATVTGAGALPTGFMKARTLTIAGDPVRYAPLPDYIDATGRDYTYVWTIAATNGLLSPIPTTSTAGTLWYYQEEPALADDTDSPLMPERIQPVVVAYAVHLAYLVRQDTNRAQVWYAEYEQGRNAAKDDLRVSVAPRSVREKSRTPRFARWS